MRFDVFIRRPVLALMLNLALLAAGVFAYTRLNVDSMPAIDVAVVTIDTRLEGANPELIESQITRPIEDAVAILGGVDTISSTSSTGSSSIQLTFTLGTDGNAALQQCRDKVGQVANDFPEGTQASTFAKLSSQEQAVLTVAVTSPRPVRELTELATNQISNPLQTVNGVGAISMSGGRKRQIRIYIDAQKLEQLNLPIQTVVSALKAHNVQVPAGIIRSKTNRYLLTVDGKLTRIRDFEKVVIQSSFDQAQDGEDDSMRVITLGDVAQVVDGEEQMTSFSRLNGQPVVTLDVKKTSDANLMRVVDSVRSKLDSQRSKLPKDVKVEIVRDNSTFVRQSVDDLQLDLLLGSALACLAVLVFLGNLRLTLIAAVAIPISLVATLAFMAALGYTLNYMTLLALSLAVGIVVDDAVVVLENISSQLENNPGMQPKDAAALGVGEIAFAVLATTLSLVVLFLPLAFMPGIVGLYFRSWGVTMAISILLSMAVSFTLTPMLCSRWLRAVDEKHRAGPRPDPLYQRLYLVCLRWSLKGRWLLLLASLGIFLTALPLLGKVTKEFTAKEDQGNFTVHLKLPDTWTMDRRADELRPVEKELISLPHVETCLTTCDLTSASVFVKLVPYPQRQPQTVFELSSLARSRLQRFGLFRPSVTLGDVPTSDFEFTILGSDLNELRRLGDGLKQKLATHPGVVDLDTSLSAPVTQIYVHIDPQRAADLGVDVQEAGQAIQAAVSGLKVSTFQEGTEGYDVRVQLQPDQRAQPQDVNRLLVTSRRNGSRLVSLEQVANIETVQGANSILRYQRQRKVAVQANLVAPMSLQEAYLTAQQALAQLKPPAGYGPIQTGDSKLMAETALAAFQSFVLSVVFMYMVMASQFENLLEPVLILLTLPLAIPFALISLIAANMSLNLFSVLGLFLLFGVVKKNAILQIDRTNQLMSAGMEPQAAILEANRDRLRPILMTTLTLVVAMLPVAFAGPTAAMRAPMAMVVVGGQSLCLLLTLVVVPAASAALDDLQRLGRRLSPTRKSRPNPEVE